MAAKTSRLRLLEERESLQTSLAAYTKAAWPQIERKRYVHNWHIDAISEHLEAVRRKEIRRLIINVPFRTMKSTSVNVMFPTWTWATDPSHQFLTGSHAEKLAIRDNLKHRRLVESPWYKERWGTVFGMTGDQNQKTRFENDQGGYRIAFGMTSGVTGDGGDTLIIDDPLDRGQADSDAERDNANTIFDQTLISRLNDPETSAIVLIMQRLHEDDLSGHLLSQSEDEWEHLMLPMEFDPTRKCYTSIGFEDPREEAGELLWPERFPAHVVESLKRTLGSYGASGQLQQLPTPAGGGIFKREWWQLYPPEGEAFNKDTGKPLRPLEFPRMEYIVAIVDTAMTTKEENDYSGCTVWGVWRNEHNQAKIMLMDAWRDRLEFRPLVERIIETARRSRIDRLVIEAKANGISVAQEIGRLVRSEEFGVSTSTPTGDKVARAHAVTHLLEARMVYAPDRKWADMVIDECAVFPKGAHDDLVDTVTAGLKHLRDLNLAYLPEEREDDLRRMGMLSASKKPALPYAV